MPSVFPSPKSAAQVAPSEPASYTDGLLKWLLAISVVLPLLIFAAIATGAYQRQFEVANERLQARLSNAYEHALKVFDTFELSARYTDELIEDLDDDGIRAQEARISDRLRAIIARMPQLSDIWVINAEGMPLVSGTVLPMPRTLDVSDRRYFQVHRNGEIDGDFVSRILEARAADLRFFTISRKRTAPDGTFAGVTTISIAPEYFVNYYSTLATPSTGLTSLIRNDGAVLARYPAPATASPPLATTAFGRALQTNPESGTFRAVSSLDGIERITMYKRLPQIGVFVVAAVNVAAIEAEWAWLMASYLAFGIPAAIVMTALAWFALRRARRESAAYAALREEVARREATEGALRQAQKMEAVGRLTGGIAHDFNNLLTAILGNVDLAIKRLEPGNDRLRRPLTSAREASRRAATLVARLLTFSRQQPLEVRVIDMNRLIRDMSDLLQRTLGEQIAIETVLSAGLWRAEIDPNQLENAVLNMAINARDAMPGGGRLTIETANAFLDERYTASVGHDLEPGQYVMLAITDCGTGMTQGVRDKAFEPFFTTKPVGVGSGLGLSMVYGFVKQSRGHIAIYSEPGEGTNIKLYFPRSVAPETAPALEAFEAAPQGAPTETVLLVEDDAELNRFGTEVLGELGYRIISAPDGPSALELLKQNDDIVLLFTDVILPNGMNGRELASAATALRPNLKVLFTTGYTRNAIVHDGRLDQGVDLLTKPFTVDALSRKVREVLNRG